MKKVIYGILFILLSTMGIQAQDIVVESVITTPVTCGGDTDGTITITVTGGNGSFSYSLFTDDFSFIEAIPSTPNLRTAVFNTGYAKGGYFIGISDTDGSTDNTTAYAAIGGPSPINITNTSSTDLTCGGAANGTITITANGEQGNLNYDLTGPMSVNQDFGNFAGLIAGTYEVNVTDNGACSSSDVSSNIILTEPTPIVIINTNTTDATCYLGNNGTISIDVSGGTPSGTGTGYTYVWSADNGYSNTSNEDISGLEAGNYTVIVNDDNGCTNSAGPIMVGEGSEITLPSVVPTNVSCNGSSDGAVNITINGGVGPYTFLWTGQGTSSTRNVQNPNDLPADTYDLTITDLVGCSQDFLSAVTITEPVPIIAVENSTTNVSCFGGSDGSATISVSNGTAPYTFSWTGPAYASTDEDPSSMPVGVFSVDITDNNGCSKSFPNLITVTQPEKITAILDGSSDVSCFGGADGSAQVTADKGTPTYTYLWTGDVTSHTSTMEDPNDLIADTYDLLVTDINSCPVTFNNIVIIGQPAAISVSSSITDAACFGGANGEINITPAGGTLPYSFAWTGPDSFTSSDEDIIGLETGNYMLTITDGNSCLHLEGPYFVDEASEVVLNTINSSNVKCYGGNDGAATITLSGGSAPYTFSWDGINNGGASTAQNPLDLIADTYNLTVTDFAGCSKAFPNTVVIGEPNIIDVSPGTIIDVLCNGGSDGSAQITPSGGTGPYTFSWTGPSYTSTDQNPLAMPAGDFTVQVSDANGCSLTFTDIITIAQPNKITAILANSTNVSCFGGNDGSAQINVAEGTPGYTYLWTGDALGQTSTSKDPNNLLADTYDLEVTDANSCAQIFNDLATITEPGNISCIINITDVACFEAATGAIDITPSGGTTPYAFSWTGTPAYASSNEDISGLFAGSYSLKITDDKGCSTDFNDNLVSENSAIEAIFTISNLSCNAAADGEIDVVISGGIAPYTVSWSGDNGYTNIIEENIIGLDAASYTLTVTDALGCENTFLPQTLTEPTAITATFTPTNSTCFEIDNGSINVNVVGGTPIYSYSWTATNGFTSNLQNITNLEPGDYSLQITDSNGCPVIYTDEVSISEPSEISVISSSVDISCNGYGDGTISATAAGGTPGYSYAWSGPNSYTGTGSDIAGLEFGPYDLIVTDAKACSKFFNAVENIDEPAPTVVTFTSQSNLACNGDADGSINIDVAGGSLPYAFSWTNSGGTEVSTDEDPSGLPADIYSLKVTDSRTCEILYADQIDLTEPESLTLSLDKTDILCAGENNGTITANTLGGTPPYEYSRFSGGPWDGSDSFTNLASGAYNIYARDANGCKTNQTVSIIEPASINYEYSIVGQNLCFGEANVTINIYNVTGGIAPFEYSIDNGVSYQDNGTFPNNPAGAYPVIVKDNNTCEKAILPLSIFEPSEIKITYHDQDDISMCYDNTDGRIAIQGSGGTSPIRYSINAGPEQSIGEFLNLSGGLYDVAIIDTNNCQRDTIFDILQPDKLIWEKADVSDVVGCPGDNTGEIDMNATGGTGSISYSFNSGAYGPQKLFSSLTAGTYLISARDGNGCIIDTTLEILEPLGMTLSDEISTDANCNGASDGSVSVTANGGTPPYTYTLNPPVLPPQTSNNTFTGLLAGDYTIDVTDFEGCGPLTTGVITIGEPSAIVNDLVVTKEISCNSASNGSITISVSGGTPPYEYSIDNELTYVTDSAFTGLDVGTYEVFAKDVNGCTLPIGTYNFTEPPAINLTATKVDVAPCFGEFTGSISATATGGWDIFEYSIDGINYQSSGDFINLPADSYTVFTRDTGNCELTSQLEITEPTEVLATVDKTDYEGANLGTITISNPSGGTGPYSYSIDGLSGTFSAQLSYTNLTFGTYVVVVMDAIGCTFQDSIEIREIIPLIMIINHTDILCYGLSDGTIEFDPQDEVGNVYFSIDSGSNYTTSALYENLPGDSTYQLMAYDDDGKVYEGSVRIEEPDQILLYSSITSAHCNAFSETGEVDLTIDGGTAPYNISWSNGSVDEDLSDVVAGWYYINITDNNLCTKNDSIYVPSEVIVTANAGKDTTICSGMTIVLNAIPGNSMLWTPDTYLTNQSTSNPVALKITESISYTYTVTEGASGYGCYNIDTLDITVLPVYGIEVTQDTFALEGQQIQLGATTDGTFVSYEWSPQSGLNFSDIIDPIATMQTSVSYILEATNDYGCVESDTVYIEVIEDIEVYNVFSPNGDNVNDYFDIDNASRFPNIIVEVYSRWGSKIFSSVGYADDQRWDGTYKGIDVPIGTYYYGIIPYPEATPITGNVTIIR